MPNLQSQKKRLRQDEKRRFLPMPVEEVKQFWEWDTGVENVDALDVGFVTASWPAHLKD